MTHTLEMQVGDLLRARGWTICTAESCTGGLILHRLTNIAGSSSYVLGGVVAYSNTIKEAVLSVPYDTLLNYGAVSEQTARAMATGVRTLIGADIALSVTGIAGPGGAVAATASQPEKPVGLTYIGMAGADGFISVRRYIWEQDREGNKTASADAALQMVLEAFAAS